jgi:hypothetical protein
MADKKISALTASSTPLAGTEVLPIVQGGSTVKVAVANLTAGRAVAFTSFTSTGGNVMADGTLLSWGNQGQAVQGADSGGIVRFYGSYAEQARISSTGIFVTNGDVTFGTAGKGITNSTGSVLLAFSTVGTALTGGAQSVLTGSFNNVGTAQTVTPDDTRGGNIVITAIQPGIGSTTYTLPFVKRGGTVAIGTPSKAILTADPILTVAASGGGIVITPVAANTFITYAIYYTPLGA